MDSIGRSFYRLSVFFIRQISFGFMLCLLLLNAGFVRAAPADCSLVIKPGGASAGGGWCPVDKRCTSSDTEDKCIPEFGRKLASGQFDAKVRQWGSSGEGGLNRPVAVVNDPDMDGRLSVLNNGDDSMTIFYCPGVKKPSYTPEKRRDLASCHFMHRPSDMAFGGAPSSGDEPDFPGQEVYGLKESGTCLVTGDSCNDYNAPALRGYDHSQRKCSDFMGPVLYAKNYTTFAIQNNDFFPDDLSKKPYGSHISMTHQSPNSLGVVWSNKDAGYWTWDAGPDSIHGSIVFTNITRTHGYGGHNHTGASLYRYEGTTMARKSGPTVPGQMALWNNFLFIADPAAGVIRTLNTKTGTESGDVKPRNEWREGYDAYTKMVGATFDKLKIRVNSPSGLAISDDRLFVSDSDTGEIYAIKLDKSGNHTLIGSYQTTAGRIAGLMVDSVKRLWFVDSLKHTLNVLEPSCLNRSYCQDTSPWGENCGPVTNSDGVSVYQAHLDESNNYDNWGGCARTYYESCPGGNVRENSTLPVCHAQGGSWKDAIVKWFGGQSTCTCDPNIVTGAGSGFDKAAYGLAPFILALAGYLFQ